MQRVFVVGNVGKDPEIREFDDGGKVANFPIAVTERAFKTRDGKEIPEHTEWFNASVGGGLAGVVENYVKKGDLIAVQGKLRTRSWEADNGEKRYATELRIQDLKLIGNRQSQEGSAPTPQQAPQQEDDDDLPF